MVPDFQNISAFWKFHFSPIDVLVRETFVTMRMCIGGMILTRET